MSTSIKLEPLDMNWALNADLPSPDFVLPGLEPEMFGLIVAPGGTGKTFFGLDVAVSVALGRDIAAGCFRRQHLPRWCIWLPRSPGACWLGGCEP